MKLSKKCFVLVLLLVFVLTSQAMMSSFPTSFADPDGSGKEWTAHTGFHIKNAATSGPTGLSPIQIKSAYNLPQTGGSGTIAIVDAYDDPTVTSDLDTFSSQFGLPMISTGYFTKNKMATSIPVDAGWALEISLDVQWAHAIAPNAKILLVEARSNSITDLLAAVDYARSQPDVVAISMSWGGNEFSGESSYDSHFTSSYGAAFFVSSGDSGAGVSWPASSSNVVAVGGTTLTFSGSTLTSETAWSGSGGGISRYEAEPLYQLNYGVSGTNGYRAVPDISYNGDPVSGVSVYDSTPYSGQTGWWKVGGTSAGAPQWAAIQALGHSATNSNLYTDAKTSYSSYFRDITQGSNGYPATTGYDMVTGLGSPLTQYFAAPPTPDFALSAMTPISIPVGSYGTSTVTVTPLNSYTGTVSLTATHTGGLTTTLNPTSVINGGTSTLTITVPTGTSPGSYTVTVTGTDGTLTHTTQVTVNIPSTTKTMSVTVSTDRSSYSRGSTARITVTAKDQTTGSLLAGASVTITVTSPTGSKWTSSGRTASNGRVTFNYRIGSTRGTYSIAATVTLTGYQTGTGSGSFLVN